jgi:hypothetical protein
MDNLSDQHISNENRVSPHSMVLPSLLGIVRWLTRLFTLTDEERKKAGISVGIEKYRE